jgi:hypothetical protein
MIRRQNMHWIVLAIMSLVALLCYEGRGLDFDVDERK